MHQKKKKKASHKSGKSGGREASIRAAPAAAPNRFFKKPWAAPLAVFCLAFFLRLIYLIQFRAAATFNVPLVDSATYYRIASDLLEGAGFGARPFWQPPLYPVFLAPALALTDKNLFMVRLVQGLIGSFSCVLLYFVGKELFSRAVGLLAAMMAACYGVLIFFDGELLAPVLIVFFCMLCFFFGLKGQKKHLHIFWALSGFCLGLAAITWGSLLAFSPVLLVWAYRSRREGETKGRTLSRPVIAAAGLFLAILPVTLYNAWVGHDLVLISTNGGINFYLGNNARADETVGIRPGYEWERLINLPWYEARTERASEDSAFFFRKSLVYLKADPGMFFRHILVKGYRFWNAAEISRNVNMYYSTRDSSLLRMLMWRSPTFCFPFGLLAPLALIGLVLAWKQRHSLLPAYGFVAALSLVVILFFVTGRYRVPVIPVLLLFAAYAITALGGMIRGRKGRRIGLFLICFLMLVIICNLPYLRPAQPAFAEIPYFAAISLEKEGNTDAAEAFCSSALEEDPSYLQPKLKLAELAFRKGDLKAALQNVSQFLDAAPDHPEAHAHMGIVLAAMGRDRDAHACFQRAIELDPNKESFHYNLALNFLALGQPDAAAESLKKAADLAMDRTTSYPKIALAANNVAERMIGEGKPEKAIQVLEWAADLSQDEKRTWKNLVAAHMLLGHDPQIFKEEIRAFVRLAPEDPMAKELKSLLPYIDTIP